MDISIFIHQVKNTSVKLINTIPFIMSNKLWQGFLKQKMVLLVSIVGILVIPLSIYNFFSKSIGKIFSDEAPLQLANMNIANQFDFGSLFGGINQYILLLLIHMLNIYFSNRTIERLSGVTIDISLKEMFSSTIRNLKVLIRNWFIELIFGIVISIIIGIFGPDWMEDILKFAVGCYFLGYIFLDNYNGTFGIPIAQSFQIIKKHAGAAIALGFVAKILLLLPVVGVFIMSFICGVAATWYMHTSDDKQAGTMAFAD